ncbi:MAG: nicotinate (nicotinamide) nucleotide adenylyltransferase [Bacteroidota bacterium]|nr:nicotinate (nicotinamide) nucleotide adenylyltransferase [Bacteroidota bacterium]MDP4206331.1 nicotinate (nicotinamide) nucleotide adenylyltransferase [Bacteroidota bacterium]
MKTGLYFGSFNPIHNGHLAIADYMIKSAGIDEIWFVVSPLNPLKDKEILISENERLELTRLAILDKPHFRICDIEFRLPRPSYTIDTLKKLKAENPNRDFVLIIGTDNLICFHHWKDYQRLLKEYEIVVYPRPGYDEYPEYSVRIVNAPQMDISSTDIRQRIADNRDFSQLLPAQVWEYIQKNKLYR